MGMHFSAVPGFVPLGYVAAQAKPAAADMKLTTSQMALVRPFAQPVETTLPDQAPKGLIPASGIKVTGGEIDWVEATTRFLVWRGHKIEVARSIADVAVALSKLKHGRGRKREKPRLFPRGGWIHMTDGWDRVTTDCPIVPGEDYRDDIGANAKLAELVEKRVRKILGRVLKKDVLIKEMFAVFLTHFKPGTRPDALDAHNHARIMNELAHLEDFMGDNTLQDLGYSSGVQYMEYATAQAIKSQTSVHEDLSEVRYVARSTARHHVVTLVTVVNWYCGGENRIDPITIKIPSVPRTAVDFLTIEEIVRLISAARGRIYDENGNIIGQHDKRAKYACVVRFIIIYLYGGTRHANILLLTWGQDSLTGHINPDLGIIERQGPLAPITDKRRETSALIGSLVELAARWYAEDEELRKAHPGRYVNIIHDEDGFPIAKQNPKRHMDAGKRMSDLFREVRELAGLPKAKPHMLKHSGVTYCARAGMPVAAVEQAFSTSFITLWTYYRSLRPWFTNVPSQPYHPSNLKLLALRRFSSKSKAKLLAQAA